MSVPILPTINASLNALAGIFLVCGFFAIKKGDQKLHKKWMLAALCTSALFLICYLTYHLTSHGITRYEKEGISRIIYFTILLTHTPLAALVVPFALAALNFALKGQIEKHKRVTKYLYPVWLYVSVTGVMIYIMLYIL